MTLRNKALSPADRLSEIIFGLIMVLTVIGATRIAMGTSETEITTRVIFIAAIGCNIAWGLVDGIMYILTDLLDRGRLAQTITKIQNAGLNESAARAIVNKELEGSILGSLGTQERERIGAELLTVLSSTQPGKVHVSKSSLSGALATFLINFCVACIVVIPFFIFPQNPYIALRVTHVIAAGIFFGVGWMWGKHMGKNPLKYGLMMVALGLVIALVTFLLGG